MVNKYSIPEDLHHLIPLVEKWGIGDDGYRDEKIESSTKEELLDLVANFTDKDAEILNEWLIDPEQVKLLTSEYLQFSAFFMAYEYAKSILKNRK